MKRPNIIFIICDQMRGDAIGADGNSYIHTPNIDDLASYGTRFPHAYCAVPSCLPARAALWSGQSQWHTGLLGMGRGQGAVPNDFPHTLSGELTRAGYRTHLVGKGHFNPLRSHMGFETMEFDEEGRMPDSEYRVWFEENAPEGVTPDDHGIGWNSWHARPWHTEERLHPTSWTMMRALEFLSHSDSDRPCFLNISFARPHSPYVPPKHYYDMYYQGELPGPYIGEWSAMHEDPETAMKENAWRGKMTAEQIRQARAGYYGEISFIDEQIGKLMNWMRNERSQQLNNTWFVFAADHGDMLGDHNLWRKTYAYEGSARIPFIVVPPQGQKNSWKKSADEVVELRDIMPTILDIADVDIPDTVDGHSVLSLMEDDVSGWREYIHGEHCTGYSEIQEMQFVTDGKRKFIWFPRTGQEQYFNLNDDAGETRDLIGHAEYQNEILLWRNHLIHELEKRECGWVKDGKLYCPANKPLVSPFRDVRWSGQPGDKGKPQPATLWESLACWFNRR